MKARLTVSYLGTPFSGWQRQPNAVTVQQLLEEALASLCGQEVRTTGAGRTDAGVHARAQVVSLELPRELPMRALVRGVNRFLTPEIRVLGAARVPDGFDARKHASAKRYRYRLHLREPVSALELPFCWALPWALDRAAVVAAAEALIGRHDFGAFALAGGAHKSSVRNLLRADWRFDGCRWDLDLVGEGFLRGMVRSLVGTLVEIGRGRREPSDMARLLAGASRGEAGPTAPAAGLTLEEVHYGSRWQGRDPYPAIEPSC